MPGGAEKYRFESTNAVVQVHVGTSGAFGFLGHGHLMEAPIQRGTVVYQPSDLGHTSVELVVDASCPAPFDGVSLHFWREMRMARRPATK